jgi:hypothetical protein
MKQLPLLFILFTASFAAKTQIPEDKRKQLPPNDILLEKAQFIVSNYKMAVILSSNCKNRNYDKESILQMFTETAMIEVSSNRGGKPSERTPKEYFFNLRNLCNGINYDSIDIKFKPDILRESEVSRFENTCMIKRDIVQRFVGFKKGNPKPVYCDVTIKKIIMVFVPQRDGSYKALISRVTVEDTQACDKN